MSGRWSPAQRDFVESQQRRRYRALADALRLGGDPRKAHAHFARSPVPLDHLGSAQLRQVPGAPAYSPAEWEAFDRRVAELHRRYSGKPQTSYEHPNRYFSMALIFGDLQEVFAARGKPLDPSPLLATLPSGDVNARILIEPSTKAPIIFFEQGLFPFFHHFAMLLGWAMPPLSLPQLADDVALSRLRHGYAIPPQSSQFFLGLLGAYVIGGNPSDSPSPIPRPDHNLFVAMTLLNAMEKFVMAHELGHVALGHLQNATATQKEAWEQEYEADEAGARLVCEQAHAELGHWAAAFWACDLALTLLVLLYRAIGIMQFGGSKLGWIDTTHPDPLSRRTRLRDRAAAVAANLPDSGHAAIAELCGMSDAIVGSLWEQAGPLLLVFQLENKRPSPLWSDTIAACLAPIEPK
jgi:IrrE N-terminal-like domain